MGLTQSTHVDPDLPPAPARSLPGYISSYFTTPRAPPTTHTHPRSTSAEITSILLQRGLPLELAQKILDLARVWDACRRECTQPITVYAGGSEPRGVRGVDWGNGQEDEVHGLEVMDSPGRVWCLVSGEVGCASRQEERIREDEEEEEEEEEEGRQRTWVRGIVVDLFSRDQGWADDHRNYGTYNGSFSWFELSLVRDGDEVPDTRCTIQHNVVAGQYFKPHHVVLDRTHPLVRAARDGDRIVLWARAQYPGWANHVRKTGMTVYTASFA